MLEGPVNSGSLGQFHESLRTQKGTGRQKEKAVNANDIVVAILGSVYLTSEYDGKTRNS